MRENGLGSERPLDKIDAENAELPESLFALLLHGDMGGAANYLKRLIAPVFKAKQVDIARIHIEVVLLPHAGKQAVDLFRDKLANTDIIVMEMIGWWKEQLKVCQMVSDGRMNPDFFQKAGNFPEFELAFFSALYKSHVRVVMVDIPESSSLNRDDWKRLNDFRRIVEEKEFHVSLKEYADLVRQEVLMNGDFQKQREEYILDHFKEDIPKIVHARFRKKPVNVLVVYGSFHTGIYHGIRETFPDVVRASQDDGFSMDSIHGRKVRFGKDLTNIDCMRQVMYRMVLHAFIYKQINEIRPEHTWELEDTQWYKTITQASSLVAFQSSEEEIRDIYNKIFNTVQRGASSDEMQCKIVETFFKKKYGSFSLATFEKLSDQYKFKKALP